MKSCLNNKAVNNRSLSCNNIDKSNTFHQKSVSFDKSFEKGDNDKSNQVKNRVYGLRTSDASLNSMITNETIQPSIKRTRHPNTLCNPQSIIHYNDCINDNDNDINSPVSSNTMNTLLTQSHNWNEWKPLSPVQYSFKLNLSHYRKNHSANYDCDDDTSNGFFKGINNSVLVDKLTKCEITDKKYKLDLRKVITQRKAITLMKYIDNRKKDHHCNIDDLIHLNAEMDNLYGNDNDHIQLEIERNAFQSRLYNEVNRRKRRNDDVTESFDTNTFNKSHKNKEESIYWNNQQKNLVNCMQRNLKKDRFKLFKKHQIQPTMNNQQQNPQSNINQKHSTSFTHRPIHSYPNTNKKTSQLNLKASNSNSHSHSTSFRSQFRSHSLTKNKGLVSSYNHFNSSHIIHQPKTSKSINYPDFNSKALLFNSEVSLLKTAISSLRQSISQKRNIIKLNFTSSPIPESTNLIAHYS